jgi:hypothetical protein
LRPAHRGTGTGASSGSSDTRTISGCQAIEVVLPLGALIHERDHDRVARAQLLQGVGVLAKMLMRGRESCMAQGDVTSPRCIVGLVVGETFPHQPQNAETGERGRGLADLHHLRAKAIHRAGEIGFGIVICRKRDGRFS